MREKKVSLIILIVTTILALTIGIIAGYLITNSKNTQNVKEVSTSDTKTQTAKVNEVKSEIKNEIKNEVKNETLPVTDIAADTTPIQSNNVRTLDRNELDLLENYLESPGIFNFIYTTYNDLTEFNLRSFLKYYYNVSSEATDEQIKDITGEENPPVPLHLFLKSSVDGFFKENTGKDVSIIKSDLLPLYTAKYNSYYNRTSDATIFDINVISGTEQNGKYVIRYTKVDDYSGETKTFEVTLNKVDNKYLFVSNVNV